MLDVWVYQYIPKIFCALAFLVNPVFIYLIFTEKSSKFGNYRFLLLFFALFNLTYSVVNVIVPLVSDHSLSIRYSQLSLLLLPDSQRWLVCGIVRIQFPFDDWKMFFGCS
ncbi:hypothetical protein CRE_19063 [Caenorhabditis remanei]|uniref:Uncharacterized protein n=1 Tax=Caenorhabditis remanei TaxID=31234 RepID=E3LLK0_CAERE|nr:hypothetical protein CRE_19063 [Caenorhabditis remanei]